jgi:chaperonin GroEL (HSP60 family)
MLTPCPQLGGGKKEIDIKRYAKVEKLPGGELEDCHVMRGVMVEKDVTHPRMRRVIRNPRVILLDCTLEYKKAESATQLEITKEEDFEAILKQARGGRGCVQVLACPSFPAVAAAPCLPTTNNMYDGEHQRAD